MTELTAAQREKIEFQRDMKRQLLRIETKYLMASGWQVHENFESADKGFVWKDIAGEPIPQAMAVATQKEWDEDPAKHKVVVLRVNLAKMITAIKVNQEQGLKTERLGEQYQTMKNELDQQFAGQTG